MKKNLKQKKLSFFLFFLLLFLLYKFSLFEFNLNLYSFFALTYILFFPLISRIIFYVEIIQICLVENCKKQKRNGKKGKRKTYFHLLWLYFSPFRSRRESVRIEMCNCECWLARGVVQLGWSCSVKSCRMIHGGYFSVGNEINWNLNWLSPWINLVLYVRAQVFSICLRVFFHPPICHGLQNRILCL